MHTSSHAMASYCIFTHKLLQFMPQAHHRFSVVKGFKSWHSLLTIWDRSTTWNDTKLISLFNIWNMKFCRICTFCIYLWSFSKLMFYTVEVEPYLLLQLVAQCVPTFIAMLRMHFQRSKSTVDSLKSVLNVLRRKLLLGAPEQYKLCRANSDPHLRSCLILNNSVWYNSLQNNHCTGMQNIKVNE